MTINQLLQKLEPTSPILQANFGIERESLRVDRQGKLVHTPHPSCLGALKFPPLYSNRFLWVSDGTSSHQLLNLPLRLVDFLEPLPM